MNTTSNLTVFVVDDDAAVRDSIAELAGSVGMRVEGYGSAAEFLRAFNPERPGCLVLDVRMAEMSGLALQQELNALGSRLPIIMLTGHGDVKMAVHAMKAGAVDFLQKPYRDQALLDSINAALSMDATARRPSGGSPALNRCLDSLTDREQEVLDYLLEGRTSKKIARALEISPRTVDAHRRNVLQKFGVRSVVELVSLYAVANGER
jgi:FixJ family two-component response regulator